MSPRLRPGGAVLRSVAEGRLTRLVPLGGRKIAASVALDPAARKTAALLAELAAGEAAALREARRKRRLGAREFAAIARPLRLRRAVNAAPPELRLIGDAAAAPSELVAEGDVVRARFAATSVILPAAGLVALDLRLLSLRPL